MNKHVNNCTPEEKQKWLAQCGWVKVERRDMIFWRHPDTGIAYNFTTAMKLALEDCHLAADSQLHP